MEITPQIIFGDVMHKRLFPKVNAFKYKIYYLALPLSQINHSLENFYLKINRWGLLSFYNKDHGDRSGADLNIWAKNILEKFKMDKADGEIVLIAMPRVLGYVFNPVSFWYCFDKDKSLRAIICEVNNTFGETHSYLCAHENQSVIRDDDRLYSLKIFHVSPFLEREGHYDFRFSLPENKISSRINFYDAEGRKKLITALTGNFESLTSTNSAKAFWQYPLITFKAITLIHWQAIKLLFKGTKYVPKPLQLEGKLIKTSPLKESDHENV